MIELLRGHPIERLNGEYVYSDTQTPTAGFERDCGYCGKSNTKEGHDGCLGEIPNVMNACCGHGEEREAYLQYWDGSVIAGSQAIKALNKRKRK